MSEFSPNTHEATAATSSEGPQNMRKGGATAALRPALTSGVDHAKLTPRKRGQGQISDKVSDGVLSAKKA